MCVSEGTLEWIRKSYLSIEEEGHSTVKGLYLLLSFKAGEQRQNVTDPKQNMLPRLVPFLSRQHEGNLDIGSVSKLALCFSAIISFA